MLDMEQHGSIVTVVGEVDLANYLKFRDYLIQVLREQRCLVVLMNRLEYIDSQGLGGLLFVQRIAAELDAPVVLRNPNKVVRRMLEMSGLDSVLTVEDQAEKPIEGPSTGAPSQHQPPE